MGKNLLKKIGLLLLLIPSTAAFVSCDDSSSSSYTEYGEEEKPTIPPEIDPNQQPNEG